MNKKFKNILASLFVIGALFISAPVLAEDIPTNVVQEQKTSTVPLRQPISRKKLAMKFIMAMMGVAASSVIIYVSLTIYNRFIYGTPKAPQPKTQDEEFKTPTNMKDALSIFLKKTK